MESLTLKEGSNNNYTNVSQASSTTKWIILIMICLSSIPLYFISSYPICGGYNSLPYYQMLQSLMIN